MTEAALKFAAAGEIQLTSWLTLTVQGCEERHQGSDSSTGGVLILVASELKFSRIRPC